MRKLESSVHIAPRSPLSFPLINEAKRRNPVSFSLSKSKLAELKPKAMASIHLLHGLSPTTPKTLKMMPKFHSSFPSTIANRSLSFPKPKSRTITCSGATTPATDRLISAVSYTLPFFNSLQYGRYLFFQFPKLGLLFEPLLPLLGLYRSIPYSSFVAFFALYLGVVRNPSFSHYVRFNAMQAVTLDVLLVLPLLIQRIFSPGQAGLGYKLMVWGHNGIFVFSVLCFVYGLVSSILGRTPYLPFVADAAGRQL